MKTFQGRLTRREFLGAAAMAAAGSIVAACAPKAAPASPAQPIDSPAAVEAPKEAVHLELWAFVNTHARWFRSMAEDYKEEINPNFELTVTEIAGEELFDKLLVALQAGGVGAPDIADIEQGSFGGFLRGEDPGLVDQSEWLKAGDYLDKIVATRLALYSYKGKIYGVEHALCPVVLYYRGDVWEDAGVDPTTFETWDDFILAAGQVATGDVKAIAFPTHDVLLRQRGGDYFDKDGNVTLDSDVSIQTMEWILDLRDKYGISDQPPTGAAWYGAVSEGLYLSHVGADWYAGFFKDNVPELSGKWKAVLLPAWQKGGLRTSCHGGTGCCIVKSGKHIEECWKFVEYSMLSVEGNVRRFEMTNLFPPYIPAMQDDRLHAPDEYFSGQDLGQLFADAAPHTPPQYQSPYRAELNHRVSSELQGIYDGAQTPADAFKKISEDIRKVMAEEGA